jgi:hypothetical protein
MHRPRQDPRTITSRIPGYSRSCRGRRGRVGELEADLEWRLTLLIAGEITALRDVAQGAVDAGPLVDGERVTAPSADGVDPVRSRVA